MRPVIVISALALLLGACAPSAPVIRPSSERAELNDRLTSDDDGSNERAFFVEEIDGAAVINVLNGTRRFWGNMSVPYVVARQVEARPLLVAIRGKHTSANPFRNLGAALSGKTQDVRGSIQFTPKAGVVYRVNGSLTPTGGSIWIENFETGEVVSEKIAATP